MLKFGTEFDLSTAGILQFTNVQGHRVKGQGHSGTNVSALKRYKTAVDRLSDFKLRLGDEIKADRDWHGVGRRQVAMHRNCHILVCMISVV